MNQQFPEREWKKLRAIREKALSRFCVRALAKITSRIEKADLEHEAHKNYLAVYKLVHRQDKQLGDLFDDWRRSTALLTLMHWAKHGVITEEEFDSFEDPTKETVCALVKPKFFKD